MNNLILWIGLIIAVLFLVYFYVSRNRQLKLKEEKKRKASYALSKEKMENFFMEAFAYINMYHNLIENGSFDHGDEAADNVTKSQNGNRILAYSNPSPYTYVLNQEISPTSDLEKVFYRITVSVKKGEFYLLEYMDYTNSSDESGLVLYSKNQHGEVLNIPAQTNIIEEMIFNQQKWVLVNQIFQIPEDCDGNLHISFETNKNSDETIFRFLAHLYLRRYLPLIPKFEFTNYLRLLLDMSPASLQINQNYWKNLAGVSGNFKIDGSSQSLTDGIYTRNVKFMTKNALSLDVSPIYNDNNFTLIMKLGSLPNDLIIKEEVEYDSILIPGNQDTAFSIRMPNHYGPIKFLVADEEFTTEKSIEPNVGGIISFVYMNRSLSIYLNQLLLEKVNTKQVYFNVKDIIINTTGNWSANLQGVLMYNNALLPETIVQIVNWFQNNSGNFVSRSSADTQTTTASIQGHVMSNCLGDDCGCSDIPVNWAYTASADPQYNEKLNNLRKCYLKKLQCPTAKLVSGDYLITIPEKSLYAMEHNSYGLKNYGSNRNKARELYTENFPMCLIPDVLSNANKTVDTTNCPFVVEKDNPCKSKSCENVKWAETKLMDLSQECKNQINQYCKVNWDKDPACLCWNPKYKDEEGCLAFMKNIKDPKDIQIKEVQKPCCLNDYPITDHPDINKYIKKDQIPCWGCKL